MAGAYILKSNIVCHFVEETNNFEDMICFNFQCHLIKLSQGNGTKFVRPNIFNICNGYMERKKHIISSGAITRQLIYLWVFYLITFKSLHMEYFQLTSSHPENPF